MTKEEIIKQNHILLQTNLILLKMLNNEDVNKIVYVDGAKDKIIEKISTLKRSQKTYKSTGNMIDLEIVEIKLEVLEEILKEDLESERNDI